jgi:protein-disulfide isomerase
MRSKVLRLGFVTTMISAVACSGAPTPQPAKPGAETARDPADKSVIVATDGADQGIAGPQGAAPAGAEKRRASRAPDLDGEGFAGEVVMGRGGIQGVAGAPPPPPPVTPAELGAWTGGDEVDAGFGAQSPIPVTAADPSWGSPKALVTIVAFSDLECPFCARATRTLDELRRIYGKDLLRIVWKNYPLAFHKNARPAAEAAMAVFALRGSPWFFAYHDALFSHRPDGRVIEGSLPRGLSRREIDAVLAKGDVGKKIDDDMALATLLGVRGTPAFFINGVFLSGAQPVESFRAIIDEQTAAAKKAIAGGTPQTRVYAFLSAQNYQKPADRPGAAPARPAEDTTTVWNVPVDGSPARGKNTAPVTMVVFSDFQCPFCVRASATVEKLATEYGDKLRIVYKSNPLAFHSRAEAAAHLALEARAQKGDAAFWKAHELLYAANAKLDDGDLQAIATALGLDVKKAMDAVANRKHLASIEKDQGLAEDIEANGTPQFFINGRRIVGAQQAEKFKEIIDDEIKHAEGLIKKGTAAAKLYDLIIKDGKTTVYAKVTIPAPTKDQPSHGPANAKVTVQMFSDFECPFCKHAADTMVELDAAFPGKIRFVWRNMPLPFHKNAMPAALAAMEAWKQKGPEGFWAMHDAFFKDQSQLDRTGIEKTASALGLDVNKVIAAVDGETYKAQIEADKKIAEGAKITGTPGFVINGYFISGAQPLTKFKKIVSRALAEAK